MESNTRKYKARLSTIDPHSGSDSDLLSITRIAMDAEFYSNRLPIYFLDKLYRVSIA